MSKGGIRAAVWMAAAALFVALDVELAPEAGAQHEHSHQTDPNDPAVAAFLGRAREASRKYHQLETAIGAGYRLVGPDFPGMGEHWVNLSMVVSRKFDPELPAILSYLRVEGRPVLTGVAYALPMLPGESPPEFPFSGAWHYHSGSIDDETLVLNPHAMDHAATADHPRLAMMHAWVWTDNPAGVFEHDNWALSFLRLGLGVPESIPPQAGKALFLLSGGVEYYARLIQLAGEPAPEEELAVRQVLAKVHDQVKAVIESSAQRGSVTEADVARLAELWNLLWSELQQGVSVTLWTRIQMLAG